MQNVLFYVILAVLGLVLGSFLNVVICRLPRKESLAFPASHCASCGHKLSPVDLIPVISWSFLRGKCRYCGEKISLRYPLIELLTAALFVLTATRAGNRWELVISLVTVLFLIPIAAIDFQHYIIPNKILLTLLPVAVASAVLQIVSPEQVSLFYDGAGAFRPLLGAVAASGILFLIALLGYYLNGRDEVMGMGDIKLLVLLGAMCGAKKILLVLLCAVLLAGAASIVMLVTRKKGRKDKIAFGPYIILSFYVVVYWL